MIKVHVLRVGEVGVSPYLPFGGDHCSIWKASGIATPKSKRIWLPVFAFYIEHPRAKILFDAGWSRDMSPNGVYDRRAQIRSLGSRILYMVNQGRLAKGEAVDEQLATLGVKPSDLDFVFISHLDCDHANGLNQVRGAKRFLVSKAETDGATARNFQSRIRFHKKWWKDVDPDAFAWNDREGPVGHAFDLFGDGSVKMVHIPGHSAGLCALKLTNPEGKFVLLFADGGYSSKSWREMITSGIALDKKQQRKSLEWIRERATDPRCVEAIASHDADVKPHVIEF